MQCLLDLAIQALASGLHNPATPLGCLLRGVPRIPEPELAQRVWEQYRRGISVSDAPWDHHFQVALAFTAFWQPGRLLLGRLPDEAHALRYLPSVGQRLQHLELGAGQVQDLAPLAACTRLRCLSLRGCRALMDGNLAALAPCTALQALDLGGLAQLSNAAAPHIARLPSLAHLNCSGTGFTDAALEALTYGQRAAAWARQAGQQLPQELEAAWPPLPLRVLRVADCGGLSGPGLQRLLDLPSLLLLDVRRTRTPRAALQPLQQKFGLLLLHGAVLSSSNALAAAVVNRDAPACACPPQGRASRPWACLLAGLRGTDTHAHAHTQIHTASCTQLRASSTLLARGDVARDGVFAGAAAAA
jgi:hypothetical protein